MSTPTEVTPPARARQALEVLRAAVPHLAEAYRCVEGDRAENLFRNEDRRTRRSLYHSELVEAYGEAVSAFCRACDLVDPEIDTSLRKVDVRAMDLALLERLRHDDEGVLRQVMELDRHVHEVFAEVRRRWPTLADSPPLPEFEEDDAALQSNWQLALRNRPVKLLAMSTIVGIFVYQFLRIVFFG